MVVPGDDGNGVGRGAPGLEGWVAHSWPLCGAGGAVGTSTSALGVGELALTSVSEKGHMASVSSLKG